MYSIPSHFETTRVPHNRDYPERITGLEMTAAKVIIFAAAAFVSISTFTLYGPIAGFIITALVSMILINTFSENSDNATSKKAHVVVGGGHFTPSPVIVVDPPSPPQSILVVEREPKSILHRVLSPYRVRPFFQRPATYRDNPLPITRVPLSDPRPQSPVLNPLAPHVSVGTGQRTPLPRPQSPVLNPPAPHVSVGTGQRTPLPRSQPLQSYTPAPHVGVGTGEITRPTFQPGEKIIPTRRW